MGTRIHVDEMLEACDRGKTVGQRQLEVFTPSGTNELHLRIGELNEENEGHGSCIKLSPETATALLEGLERGMLHVGYVSADE